MKPKCNRIRYPGRTSAKKALYQQQDWDARVRRIYLCKECHAFHLTSQKAQRRPWR